MKKKKDKKQIVLSREDLTKQPLGVALRGIVSGKIAGMVQLVIDKKLEKAFNEMIAQHKGGTSWKQLSLFSTQEVQDKYIGDNKLVFDIHMSELVDDPKRYQEAFNAVCQLAYVDVVVPIEKPDKNGEATLLVTKAFNLLIRANVEKVKDKDGNEIFRYKRHTAPVIGLSMERVVAEYINSLEGGYSEILPFPVKVSSSKHYYYFYSYLCDFKRREPREVTVDYNDVRRLAELGSVEEDTKKGEEEIVEEAMAARREAERNGTPEKAPTDEQIEEMKRNNTRYYIVFSQFFKRILKPVMEEMKENAEANISDIWFEVEKIYLNGRAKNPDKLRFIIHLSELGKDLQNDREVTKEVMEMEERLQREFKQSKQQVRKIMKAAMKFRKDLMRKMNELSAAKESGKLKIETDESAYWNVAFTNFIEKMNLQQECETLPFVEEMPTAQAEQRREAATPEVATESELSVEDTQRWGRVMKGLREQLPEREFNTWFGGGVIRLVAVDGDKLTCLVPSRTYIEDMESNYIGLLAALLKQEWGRGAKLFYNLK